jgi:hypothetical protein
MLAELAKRAQVFSANPHNPPLSRSPSDFADMQKSEKSIEILTEETPQR